MSKSFESARAPQLVGALPYAKQVGNFLFLSGIGPFVGFFACGENISQESPDIPLPDPIVKGAEQFLIMSAIEG
jgi:hypothetical protein